MSDQYTLLVENFLFEINKNNPRYDDPDETVLDYDAFDPEAYDEEDTLEDEPAFINTSANKRVNKPITINQVNAASRKNSKLSRLKKLISTGTIVSLAAAALMFNNAPDEKVANIIANDSRNQISQKEVLNKIKKEETNSQKKEEKKVELKFSADELSLDNALSERRYAGEGITTENTESIYNFEGFRAKPYVDKEGISIGFGIQIFSNKKNYKSNNWQEAFFCKKLGLSKDSKGKITRNGKSVKLTSITSITESEAREATRLDMEERIDGIKEIYPWFEKMPGDAKLVFLDMTYNMGLRFRMTGVKKSFAKFANNIGTDKIENWTQSIKDLQEVIYNMKYKVSPTQLEGGLNSKKLAYSGYAVAGKSKPVSKTVKIHRRPQHMINILEEVKSEIQEKINAFKEQQKENIRENFSLKNVYKHLYS